MTETSGDCRLYTTLPRDVYKRVLEVFPYGTRSKILTEVIERLIGLCESDPSAIGLLLSGHYNLSIVVATDNPPDLFLLTKQLEHLGKAPK